MQTLTQVLEVFLNVLFTIPENLRNISLGLLCVFTIIDISLEVFNLEEIDWNKYIVKKVFRVGILIFLITKWGWLLDEIILGFQKIVTKAINMNITSDNFFENPSKIIDLATETGNKILSQGSITTPLTNLLLIFIYGLVMIGFFIFSFTIVIALIEFYLLTGFAIIFIPFGTLKVGENYYVNVLKLVVGCSVKVGILNLLVLITQPIIVNLSVNLGNGTNSFLHAAAVILIIAYITIQIPGMAAALLGGSPALNANTALQTGLEGLKTTLIGMTAITMASGRGSHMGTMIGNSTLSDKERMTETKISSSTESLFSLEGVGNKSVGELRGSYSSLDKNNMDRTVINPESLVENDKERHKSNSVNDEAVTTDTKSSSSEIDESISDRSENK